MKLNQVLKEIGIDDSWEQQKYVLRCIWEHGVFMRQDSEYREDRYGVTLSGVVIASVIFPANYKYEVMIKELSKPENFLDMLEFAYVKGEVKMYD